MIASVVLAITIIAVTMPFAAGAQNQQEEAHRTAANFLAQELMEETLSRSFEDGGATNTMGPEAGENSHTEFDSVNDYDGMDEPVGEIVDAAGQVVSDPAAVGLSRHARVRYLTVGHQQGSESKFASIEVEIRYNGQSLLKLTRLFYDSSQ